MIKSEKELEDFIHNLPGNDWDWFDFIEDILKKFNMVGVGRAYSLIIYESPHKDEIIKHILRWKLEQL
jgi:hypothetical protein